MKPTEQMKAVMTDHLKTLTAYLLLLNKAQAATGQEIFIHGSVTHALASVTGWLRDYERGNADAGAWFDIDTAAFEAWKNADAMLKSKTDRRILAQYRELPGLAYVIDCALANGYDPVGEIALVLDFINREERKGAA